VAAVRLRQATTGHSSLTKPAFASIIPNLCRSEKAAHSIHIRLPSPVEGRRVHPAGGRIVAMTVLWVPLIAKAIATSLLVVSASILAESLGPFWGALIASLPVSAGPTYVFLAIGHDSAFVAASALSSFAANAATGAFLITYAMGVRRWSSWWGLGAAVATWLIASLLIRQFTWTPATAMMLNLIVFAAGLLVVEDTERSGSSIAANRRRFDLPLRAAVIALFVCTVIVASSVFGPEVTGIVTVFPISLGSLIVILQPRLGRRASASLAATALRSMFGFGLALLTLHLIIPSWGAAPALSTALLVTIAWSAMLLALRRRASARPPVGNTVT
jgi:hypothetical protein